MAWDLNKDDASLIVEAIVKSFEHALEPLDTIFAVYATSLLAQLAPVHASAPSSHHPFGQADDSFLCSWSEWLWQTPSTTP